MLITLRLISKQKLNFVTKLIFDILCKIKHKKMQITFNYKKQSNVNFIIFFKARKKEKRPVSSNLFIRCFIILRLKKEESSCWFISNLFCTQIEPNVKPY